MRYKEAKKKAYLKIGAGALISVISALSTAISIFRMIYFRLDDGTAIAGAVAQPFKVLVYQIYDHTRMLYWFWANSPVPNPQHYDDPQTIQFFVIYLAVFIGVVLCRSGKKLLARLAEIDRMIEDEMIAASLRGATKRSKQELQNSADVSEPSIWSQGHSLYIAPIVATVIGGILLKVLGFA